MKHFALLWMIPVALVAALLVAQQQRRKTPEFVLSRYPQTPTLRIAIGSYLHPAPDARNIIFRQSNFGKTLNGTMDCAITKDGFRSCWSGSDGWGSGRVWQLKPAQIAAIRAVTRAMPPTISTPAPENLTLVGFWQNGRWTVQIYDKSRLPWQLKRIERIIKGQ